MPLCSRRATISPESGCNALFRVTGSRCSTLHPVSATDAAAATKIERQREVTGRRINGELSEAWNARRQLLTIIVKNSLWQGCKMRFARCPAGMVKGW
jgi:hypothetical protein